ITTSAPSTKVYGGSFTVAATSDSALTVSYGSTVVGVNTGDTFTMTSGTGTCTVHYTQAGNANYNAATEKTEDVTASKANQTISRTEERRAGKEYSGPFTVAATNESALTVSYGSTGVCTNTGDTFKT